MKIYNTLTRKKEDFRPINPDKVGIYVCGVTVYDSCHLGHARCYICFDVIIRYLRYKYKNLTFVRNYTDIDDKIIKRANDEGRSCREIAEKYIEWFRRDMAALGNLTPDIEPKATEHVADMISTIQKLIDNGYAYAKGGNVFYSVRKFRGYGRLSGKNIDELEAGARVDVNEEKGDPLDFALWKASKPGEPKWSSPWGEGRPGWHIECSSMSSKYLGQPFDIHGGGRDLIFPHHENEIAQAEGAEGKKFVNCWMHNGFININAEKMSKSLGNITTISDVIKRHGAEAVRYFIISNHYRSPMDYTEKALHEATTALDRFYETARRLPEPKRGIREAAPSNKSEEDVHAFLQKTPINITFYMDDDFNTAGAIGAIFDCVRAVNRYIDTDPDTSGTFYQWVLLRWNELRSFCDTILGIFNTDPEAYFRGKKSLLCAAEKIDEEGIRSLLNERREARKNKDFGRADKIRNQLMEMGIEIKDRPDGTTEWQIK